ncbi:hypothetical protein JAO29_05980 [Edaphobacter sp. HDX4]|uniref:hypothetical protein n=1 Tax=Edaphobacter sp. HDX4 TaxID=2794064 RepID=UPI002FE5A7F1
MHISHSSSPTLNDAQQDRAAGGTNYTEMFIDQVNSLFLLSFLVAADRRVADRCFFKALDEYVEAPGGFLEWAKEHGRRAVLRQAIKIIEPASQQAYSWAFRGSARPLVLTARRPFASITFLNPFERFVFVMSVIEGISEKECAVLLNCSGQDVAIGRELAEKLIAAEAFDCGLALEMDLLFGPSLLN